MRRCGLQTKNSDRSTCLLYTAGLSVFKSATELDNEGFDRGIAVNLIGAWHAAHAVMPGMVEKRKGKIVVIGSTTALSAIPKNVAYTAAKHGLVGMIRALAVDLGPHNINVNLICPSTIDTPMLRKATKPVFIEKVTDRIPMGRIGTMDDIVNAIMFMASEASDWVTGVALPLDGGQTCCLRAPLRVSACDCRIRQQ